MTVPFFLTGQSNSIFEKFYSSFELYPTADIKQKKNQTFEMHSSFFRKKKRKQNSRPADTVHWYHLEFISKV